MAKQGTILEMIGQLGILIEHDPNLEGVGRLWNSFKQGQWLKVREGASEWRVSCAVNGMGSEQMISE